MQGGPLHFQIPLKRRDTEAGEQQPGVWELELMGFSWAWVVGSVLPQGRLLQWHMVCMNLPISSSCSPMCLTIL